MRVTEAIVGAARRLACALWAQHQPKAAERDYRCTRCGERVTDAAWGAEHVRPDYRLYDGLRKGWGLQVDWWSGGISKKAYEAHPGEMERLGELTGFEPGRRPRAGDLFYTDMVSGNRILWLVLSADHMTDPNDMYRATVYALGPASAFHLDTSTVTDAGSDWV